MICILSLTVYISQSRERNKRSGAPLCVHWSGSLAGPINLSPMADLHYDHSQNVVLDFINDAIDALTDSIPLLSRQFFASLPARFLGKRLDTFQNAGNLPLWQGP